MPVDPRDFPIDVAAYRAADHRWLAELDRHVVHAGAPHHRMGTHVVDEADWLRLDDHADAERALRRRLVAEATDEVLAVEPGSEPARAETADVVLRWLGTRAPVALAAWDDTEPDPLVRAGLAVQDDLCLMERSEQGWRLTAALVCFPTSWLLADKIGRAQPAIHGPVPRFDDDGLAARVDRFFDRLAPGRIVGRRNWGITPHPLLFVPDAPALPRPDPWGPEHLWIRSERQTLRRLPETGAVLFTIRVQLAPLPAVRAHPQVAARLLDAIDEWPADIAADRVGPHDWRPGALDLLREAAAG